MISGIKCKDLQKEYFDVIDDTPTFIRREECEHYEIKMKRISKDEIFQKFVINIVCKGCQNEVHQELYNNEKIKNFNYQCRKCKSCTIIFRYEYIQTNNDEEIDYSMSAFKDLQEISYAKEEKCIKKCIPVEVKDKGDDEPPLPAGCTNANENNKKPIKENEGLSTYVDQKLSGGQGKVKEYTTPIKPKIYNTPIGHPTDSKINTIIKVKIIYNDKEKFFEFNSSETIKNQYNKIQEGFGFIDMKPLILNSKDIDLNKTFKFYKISDGSEIEIDNETF